MSKELLSVQQLVLDDNQYIVFGAGKAGELLRVFLMLHGKKIMACDNNPKLQDETRNIVSVESAAKIDDGIFLVAFYGNNVDKMKSAEESLIYNGVEKKRIFFLEINSLHEVVFLLEMEKIWETVCSRKIINQVDKIVFLAMDNTKGNENYVGGGPLGALKMQKKFLGLEEDKTLSFPFYHYEDIENFGMFSWILNPILCAFKLGRSEDNNNIYVANDVFSAFGAIKAGRECCLIHHAQGDFLKEFALWGKSIPERVQTEILKMEQYVLNHAFQVRFPSDGAKKYFIDSFERKPVFDTGLALYNTLYDNPDLVKIDGIERQEGVVTFLSIGQMTELKGMDRVPIFLENYAKHTDKRIRWIVVADGILKEKVSLEMKRAIEQNAKIEFVNIDYKLSHDQIYYLMQICDIYLMLHRVSIFDFSTLEAMYMSKAIILSNILGNTEFSPEDNICLIDDVVDWEKVSAYVENNVENGMKNRLVYDKYFSSVPFVERYTNFINEFIDGVEANS